MSNLPIKTVIADPHYLLRSNIHLDPVKILARCHLPTEFSFVALPVNQNKKFYSHLDCTQMHQILIFSKQSVPLC